VSEAIAKRPMAWFWVTLAAIVALYIVFATLLPPGADTLWRLHIGDMILSGKSLYYDVIEVNPPLWFWGALPAAALGGYPALVALNLVSGLISAWLLYRLLSLTVSRGSARAGAIGLACGLFLVNVGEIGQREQAFLGASALWAALAAARIEGKLVPISLLAAIVCLSAYGFALKHYFILVPIAIELAMLANLKSKWRPLRFETVALGILAIAYGAAVVILTPDFLGPILDLVRTTYFGFGMNSLSIVERQVRVLMVCTFLVVPVVCWVLVKDKRPITVMLFAALAMSFVAIVLQQKGWRYHLIAANGLSLLLIAMMFQQARDMGLRGLNGRILPLSFLALIFTSFVNPALSSLRTNGEPMDPALVQIVAAQPKDHHIGVLSTAPDRAFYVLARARRLHWTRHYSMWMMPGAITPQRDPVKDARRRAILNKVIGEFSDDLMCVPPNLIIGEVGYVQTPKPIRFDAVALLRERPMFRAWLDSHYERRPDRDGFAIYRLEGPKPAAQNCLKPR
jgi:hypothetical protein